MKEEFEIICMDQPEWSVIGGGVHNFNIQKAGPDNGKSLCFVLKTEEEEEVVGGVIGAVHWDWLYVDLMWIREDLRGRGFGRRLMTLLEATAREHGAKNAYLDTFSFQAPGFYQKQGYQVFGTLEEFPEGHQRFYLRKQL